MTNTTTSNTHTDSAPSSSIPDARPNFQIAARLCGEVFAGIGPDQLDLATPCKDFTVGQLCGHVIAVANRIGVLGQGGDFFATPQSIDVAFADRPAAYSSSVEVALDAWAVDGALDQTITVPWGVLPGAAIVMMYVNELSVHTWDLATATGQQPVWNDDALGMALFAMQFGLPRDGRSANGDGADGVAPFATVVDVDDDAPLIDRLVAWNGRRP